MGNGNRINSVIEAESRARELGGPEPEVPDSADQEAERKAVGATWLIGGLAVIAAGWWLGGPGVAAIVFACLAVLVLIDRWVRSRFT